MPVPLSDCAALLAESESLLAARRLLDAVECFRKAEAAGGSPDRCAAGRWMAYMLLGEYESAWQESDSIRKRGMPDPNRFWQGEDLTGKRVIVRCLHGYGDAVQFLRYIPLLNAVVSRLIVEVPPRLVELAQCFDGIDHLITWGAKAPPQPPAWDVQVEVMELPYIFRTQRSELPLFTNYLHLPSTSNRERGRRTPFRVGLVSAAGAWNPARAIPMEMLQPLFSIDECEFWNLCGGPENVRGVHPMEISMHEDSCCSESIEGLAAIISELDLVITVDTLAAHLAGALGVKTWVLLQYQADWRWMHDRSDCPWYPSAQLFRQPVPGDWKSVVASVYQELRNITHRERRRQVA
jgi:hypothetical protein